MPVLLHSRLLSSRVMILSAMSACAMLLSGCMTLPAPTTAQAETLQVRTFSPFFVLKGRVSARNQTHHFSGGIVWLRTASQEKLDFVGPLSQQLARVVATEGRVVFETAEGERHYSASLDALLARLLPGHPPVNALRHWVQGALQDKARVLRSDAQGRLVKVTDQGWVVDYLAYASDAADARPRIIAAQRGDEKVRIVIDQWRAQP